MIFLGEEINYSSAYINQADIDRYSFLKGLQKRMRYSFYSMYYNPIAPHLFPTKRHLLLSALVLIVVSLGVIVKNKKEDEKKKVITERNMSEIELQDKQGEKNIDNAEEKDILSGITYNKDGEIDVSSIAMPDGTQDLATEDWLTYRNEEYGFSFMYPRGSLLQENQLSVNVKNPNNFYGSRFEISIVSFSFEEFIKKLEKQHYEEWKTTAPEIANDSPISHESTYYVSGFEGLFLEKWTAIGINHQYVYLKTNTKNYLIDLGRPDPYVHRILSTLRVLSSTSVSKTINFCDDLSIEFRYGNKVEKLFPIKSNYINFEYLGQIFTAYECGAARLHQLEWVEGNQFTKNLTITQWQSKKISDEFSTILTKIGFSCVKDKLDDLKICGSWSKKGSVSIDDLLKLKPFLVEISTDSCENCYTEIQD